MNNKVIKNLIISGLVIGVLTTSGCTLVHNNKYDKLIKKTADNVANNISSTDDRYGENLEQELNVDFPDDYDSYLNNPIITDALLNINTINSLSNKNLSLED